MNKQIGAIKLPINRLHMELTNICNFSCEFCPDSKMKRKKGMMSVETARSIIDNVAGKGLIKLLLFHVMGEPSLHPRLVDIVQYASDRGIETCLTTNGSRLDAKMLQELIRAGIGQIIVSLQTPDEKTFSYRGAKGITFDDYADKIISIAKYFLTGNCSTKLTVSFLSSPLRRLIIPIFPEVSIADRTSDLKKYLMLWYEKIAKDWDTPLNPLLLEGGKIPVNQIKKIWTFKENTINISSHLQFHTRVMGDWSVHFDKKNVNAVFGYCPGIQENFGILWNGDYTFCCTDFDGRTSSYNCGDTSIADYLGKEAVQEVVKGFNSFRVVHPYCKQCLGDRNLLNAFVKQIGSIVYFKWVKESSLQKVRDYEEI
ncbi:MAG: radical SAM protein [Nitrospiraceae bacterium]|nr:MAG: radical SAM protein [Nitrospiraceae bacterium]